MIPELGKYAVPVLSAYGGSLLLLAGLVVLSVRRAARVRAALREIEARVGRAPAAPPAPAAPRPEAPGQETAHG
ncbi:MAG: heme exporter protein CcmD [Rhodobacteraceae bacterium]|nr:heme exporter protein CcmD [Paracoccaceae bacterium]